MPSFLSRGVRRRTFPETRTCSPRPRPLIALLDHLRRRSGVNLCGLQLRVAQGTPMLTPIWGTAIAQVIGTTVPTHASDASCNGAATAEWPGVQTKVALELCVPCFIVWRGVPGDPLLVGHGGAPLQERHGIRADRIPQLPAVTIDDLTDRLAYHERRHRTTERGRTEGPEAPFVR